MARPKKLGFDSFDLSTEFFTDHRVHELASFLGSDAVIVLLSIYVRALRHNGYYLQNSPTSLYLVVGDVHSSAGVDIAFVRRVIDASVSLGIFDKNIYETYAVLTSSYLQQQYLSKCKIAKRRNIDIEERYRIITIEEDKKKKTEHRKKIDINELSRMIVQGWNMAFSAHPSQIVPEDMLSDPLFIDGLKELIEKYPDYAEIDPWFALFRNALLNHPELHLASIVCDEPIFRILFDMGEPTNFIPNEFSPPRNMIHPAVIQEARMKRSGYSDEEITEATSRLLEQHQEAVSEMTIPDQPPTPFSPESIQEALDADDEDDGYDDTVTDQKKQEEEEPTQIHDENVVTVYQDYASVQPESIPVFITNESTSAVILEGDENNPTEQIPPEEELESPTRFTLPNDLPSPAPPSSPKKWFTNLRNQPIIMDGKELLSPEEEARREVLRREKEEVERISAMEDQKSDDNSPYTTEYDPELSPLLKQILHTFNTKYEEQNYPYMDELRIDEEFFSQEKHALDYLRAYIEKDERCRDIEFWKVMVDGVIHLFTFRSRHWKQEKPHCLLYVLTPPIVPETEKRDRLRLLDSFIGYFNYPNKLSDPTA